MTQVDKTVHSFMVAAVPFIGSVFFDGVVPFLMHLYQSDTVLGIRLKKLIIIFRGGDTLSPAREDNRECASPGYTFLCLRLHGEDFLSLRGAVQVSVVSWYCSRYNQVVCLCNPVNARVSLRGIDADSCTCV